jgi:hypothetical protein
MIGLVLGIVITVAIGAVVYAMASGLISTTGSSGQVQLSSDSLVVPTGGSSATWAITIKDSGTKPVTFISATLGLSIILVLKHTYVFGTSLAPGESLANSTSSITGSNVPTVGDSYTVTIAATFSDGSTYSYVTSVPATTA